MATYIGMKNPYGGFGLRAKKASSAHARIDRLLSQCGRNVVLTNASLWVDDPSDLAFIELVLGKAPEGSAYFRPAWLPRSPSVSLAEGDHTLCKTASEAWATFGEPVEAGYRCGADDGRVEWGWLAEPDSVPSVFGSYMDFLEHHDMVWGMHDTQVNVKATWNFDLLEQDNGQSGCPSSEIHATFTPRWSSAFLEIVFPFAEPSAAFWQSYEAVSGAMKMQVPKSSLRAVSPTRAGGEKWRKLPKH